jgi:hypothetical protein
MSDAGPWYSTLDPEIQAHATAKGWTKAADITAGFAEAAKAHLAAEKLIGVPADQVLRLPKDASDPTFQSAYDRIVGMVTPKTPEEYKFDGVKFRDGTDLALEDADFIRGYAVKHKLPIAAALDLAAALTERAETSEAADAAAAETTKATNAAHLRMAYGADHDFKLYSAGRAVEAAGLPPALMNLIATLPAEDYRKSVDALVALSAKMNERPMHQGTGIPMVDPTASLTPTEARQRLDAFTTDPGLRAKFLAGDTDTVETWKKLTAIDAASRVPRQ